MRSAIKVAAEWHCASLATWISTRDDSILNAHETSPFT
jgi:hypothetical protein